MRTQRSTALVAGLLSLLAASGCSTGSSSSGQDLYVVACSLACTNGEGGQQVSCSIVNTYRNQELAILFSDVIDLSSVNSSSFRVTNPQNGTSPQGQFFLDPLDNRRLIFRPSLTFDSSGKPNYGFDPFTTYQIFVPGTAQGDPPPYILNASGKANQSRLECTIFTSADIIDPVPGPPIVKSFVTTVAYDGGGVPTYTEDVEVVLDPEVVDVYLLSPVRFEFNDIMNISTLMTPSTGKASKNLKIEMDLDGNLATLSDRQPWTDLGNFVFQVDQELLTTTLLYTHPTEPFLDAGTDSIPRRIAITVTNGAQDLFGNGVTVENGGGTRGCVPEPDPGLLLPGGSGEGFLSGSDVDPASNEDAQRTTATWGAGRLAFEAREAMPLALEGAGAADVVGNPDPERFPDTLGHFPSQATDRTVDLGRLADLGLVGATSRWFGAEDQSDLLFQDDLGVDAPGWNLQVVWRAEDGSETLVPFRGKSDLFDVPFEQQFGRHLGTADGQPAAPLVVRFQGARMLPDAGGLEDGSVTPWVDHPALLNGFDVRPNVVRFTVLFDGASEAARTLEGRLLGVTGLGLRARAVDADRVAQRVR